MPPAFIYRVDEIGHNPTVPIRTDAYGHWIPSLRRGDNIYVEAGATGIHYYCDGRRIQPLPNNRVPQESRPYSTFSVFYAEGYGFWVLKGNATGPPPGEAWQPLWFDHDGNDFSSYLTNAGTQRTLRCQRPDQWWPNMLLPNIYQTHYVAPDRRYGGLKGELAIFLALMALSMEQTHVQRYLPPLLEDGIWTEHGFPHGRRHQRGVVVNIWTCPAHWGANTTAQELRNYEDGVREKYYP